MSDSFGLPLGGQRLVVAERASRVTGREIAVPGLRAHPDRLPTSPSSWDDEFDSGSLASWTKFGAQGNPTTDIATIRSHLILTSPGASGGSHDIRGILRSAPAMPFTVTAKLAEWDAPQAATTSTMFTGLILADALTSPTKLFAGHFVYFSNECWFRSDTITLPTTDTGNTATAHTAGFGLHPPVYLRLVVASASSVSFWFSFGGLRFIQVGTTFNPGFTPVAIGVENDNLYASAGYASVWDWIRCTQP